MTDLPRITQSPTEDGFVQNPYPFYDRARSLGDLVYWTDYKMPVAVSHQAVSAILKDRRFGREAPVAAATPLHLDPFYAVEAHSMLELEPPRHTRLRGLVLRAFTSRRITGLAPEIRALCDRLASEFPRGPFNLLDAYAQKVPVIVIARLLGVPETMAPQLLSWSNAMVAMYQARRNRAVEEAAANAAAAFADFLRDYVETRRNSPANDLISHLIAAEEDGKRLSTDELITTCILLLNAGHEATVHTIGNGVKALLSDRHPLSGDPATVEEILRFDPPLHLFTRHVYEVCTLFGHRFTPGDEVGCLLAAANRDPNLAPDPARFDPTRPAVPHLSFGAGIHFCVGAPLARLELQIALDTLKTTCPALTLTSPPRYANLYHFHGLERLTVTL